MGEEAYDRLHAGACAGTPYTRGVIGAALWAGRAPSLAAGVGWSKLAPVAGARRSIGRQVTRGPSCTRAPKKRNSMTPSSTTRRSTSMGRAGCGGE